MTGELASLQAEGFEKIRDGIITESIINTELARFEEHDNQKESLSRNMEYFFWVEMKRAINMDQANEEGANSYNIAEYQDPIDVKLNRVLSSKHLRGCCSNSHSISAPESRIRMITTAAAN